MPNLFRPAARGGTLGRMITISAQWQGRQTLRVWACEWYRAQKYPRTLFEFDLAVEDAPGNAHEVARVVAAAVQTVLDADASFGR